MINSFQIGMQYVDEVLGAPVLHFLAGDQNVTGIIYHHGFH